jgi:hypothetical protein
MRLLLFYGAPRLAVSGSVTVPRAVTLSLLKDPTGKRLLLVGRVTTVSFTDCELRVRLYFFVPLFSDKHTQILI